MVTHPFHPLHAQRLEVLSVRRWGTSRLYVCDGGALGSIGIPEDATDRGPEPAERPLSLEALAEAAALVAAIATADRGER